MPSPLHEAIDQDALDTIRALLVQGMDVNTRWYSMTPLMIAAAKASNTIVQFLIDRGAAIDATARDGTTALMFASMHGYASTAQLLLNAGATVDLPDRKGWTALHHSAIFGLPSVLSVLLESGASIHAKTQRDETALDLALKGEHVQAVMILKAAGARFADTRAASSRRSKALRYKFERLIPLLYAVDQGDTANVQKLLDTGVDVDTRARNGFTLLMRAAQLGHADIVDMLLARGANINASAPGGWTALTEAASRGHLATVQLLLNRGANLLPSSERAWAALSLAALRGHRKVVEALLERAHEAQIKLDLANALMHATRSGHAEIIEVLKNAQI